MPTYAAPIQLVSTKRSLNAGGATVTLAFEAIATGRHILANFENVPTANGVRQTVVKVNSLIYGRRWHPQPFADALLSLFVGSDVQLPDGFIGKPYEMDWIFQSDPTVLFSSGSLPPGLSFAQVSLVEWTITGTPTTVGDYTFQLRVNVGNTYGFITFHIQINAVPQSGNSYIGGI